MSERPPQKRSSQSKGGGGRGPSGPLSPKRVSVGPGARLGGGRGPARGAGAGGGQGWGDRGGGGGPGGAGGRMGPRFGPKFGGGFAGKFDRSGGGKARFSREADRLPASVRVVHDDDDLIVVDKPPGLLTSNLPGETRPALFDMLKAAARARAVRMRGARGAAGPRGRAGAAPGSAADEGVSSRGPGRRAMQKVFIVHRLDKEASGLLVFALSEKAFGWLKEDFKSKRVHRIYHALVQGEMGRAGDAGTIQSFIRENADGSVRSIRPEQFRGSSGGDDDAKAAVTHYRVVGVGRGFTLVQVRLETGRKNQIRVHMAERGHPLVGDARFGATADPLGRLGLHAGELGFTHPGTGQTVRYRSAPPPAFYTLVGLKPPGAHESGEVKVADATPVQGEARAAEPEPAAAEPASAAAETAPASGAVSRVPENRAAKRAAAREARAAGEARAGQPADEARGAGLDTSWNGVAAWYDAMLSPEQINDHYRDVILPGTIRLVQPRSGMRVLDVACGQGVVARAMAELGASVVGTDAAAALIAAARSRVPVMSPRLVAGADASPPRQLAKKTQAKRHADADRFVWRGMGEGNKDEDENAAGRAESAFARPGADGASTLTFHTLDARELDQLARLDASAAEGSFDAATCVMALSNIDPLEPVFRGVAALVRPGGKFVAVLSHPAFRAPKQTSWGWDESSRTQYRRVDGYLSAGQHPIQMHPGKAASGREGGEAVTWTFHRPLQHYACLLGESGLLIETIEEWPGKRVSQPGPKARAENRARSEIPLFIAIRAVRVDG